MTGLWHRRGLLRQRLRHGGTWVLRLPGGRGAFKLQRLLDAFVAKVNPSGTALVYAGFLGGNHWEYGYGIAVDASGNAYVTGGPVPATSRRRGAGLKLQRLR
jgi:hypothetical protein